MIEYSLLLLVIICEASAQTLVITNGPVDAMACIGGTANIPCGFINESGSVTPNWRIIRRNNDDAVISDMSVTGPSIISNPSDGLQWMNDRPSGQNHTNSELVVGPVDESYDQSSYQCYFTVLNDDNVFVNVTSTGIGTMTVYGSPSPVGNINISGDVTCETASVSWDPVTSDPVCGPVSYNVTISPSDGAIMMRRTDTSYSFTKLTPNTTYTTTVAGRNDAGVGEHAIVIFSTMKLLINFTMADSVMNLMAKKTTNTEISVSWAPHSVEDCIEGLVYYASIFIGNKLLKSTNTSDSQYTFDGLENGTYYIIKVFAAIGMNNGTPAIINASTTNQGDNSGGGDSDSSTGAIVGGVVGGIVAVVLVIVIIVVIYFFCLKMSKTQQGPSKIGMQGTEKTPSPVDEPVAYATTETDKVKLGTGGLTYADLDIGKGPAAPSSVFPQDRPTYGQVKPSN